MCALRNILMWRLNPIDNIGSVFCIILWFFGGMIRVSMCPEFNGLIVRQWCNP